jgi:hypothetical protein
LKKFYFILIIAFVLILLAACSGKDKDGTKDIEDGLIINSISIGLGGEIDKTEVNYSFNLWNRTKRSITILSVMPILDQSIQETLITKEITNEINKELLGNTSEIVKGSFIIDTQGLDKKDIENLNIRINDFIINSQQNIGIYKP